MKREERTEKLKYLIGCLEKEMPQYADYIALDDAEEAFRMYRALCNVRMPRGSTGHSLPERFYEIQAEVLKDITEEKGITKADSLPVSGLDQRLSLWQGDITTLQADAIVNAANSQMLGCFSPLHGCIDNMIQTMAGVELREECYRYMRHQAEIHGGNYEEPTGRAVMTGGYNLPADHVIHTVGPIVQGWLRNRDRELLASCYRSVLDCSDADHLENVAFCCISTGVFSFPQDKAAAIAVSTVREWLDQHPETTIRKVIFNVFKDADFHLYDALLKENF